MTTDEWLIWLIEHADRNPSVAVRIETPSGVRAYQARVWRDGTIALRPVGQS